MWTAKKSVIEGIKERDERPLYIPSKRRKFTADDLDTYIQLDRVEACVREIKEIRENYEAIDGDEYDEPLTRSAPSLPWNEWQPERRSLKHRHIEKRHQLLGQVLTDLLEVISSEVGLHKVDTVLYSDHYIPQELFKAPTLKGN
ncbi:MAG: hypothetical protein JW736_04515 [Deltaproteobacteria bacterium]|nr:hypothetical protein [Deltaproteobacteria bacterium]